jgi:CHAD domain-containing protein/HD superfamily phosphodiesterase
MLPGSPSQGKKSGLAYWANRVLEECDKACVDFAADPVHDLRVAIRRCRSMADGFLSVDPDPAWKQMKRLAKPLFSSLGELRDAQVMMEWVTKLSHPGDPVGESLLSALTQKEQSLKAAAQESLAAFGRDRWTSLNAHLAKRTDAIPVEGLVFQHLALERWMDAREQHRTAFRNRSSVAYHQLRIGIKRFRYTVENFLPQRHEKWSKDLRDLQDALGDVHDFDVLRAMIRSHADLPVEARLRWQKQILQERQRRLAFYRQKMMGEGSLWITWRDELPQGQQLEEAAMEKLRVWASLLEPDVAHSTRVTRIALQLFDGLTRCEVLQSVPSWRRILEAAALLHEVGRKKPSNDREGSHQERGHRKVLKLKPPLGWSEEEIQYVALLVRYHRGAVPVATNSSFVGLSSKQRSELMPMIAILRLANAFDDPHDGSISRITVERRDNVVTVYGEGLQRLSQRAEQLAKARYLLEAVTRLPIMIRPAPVRKLASSRTNQPQRKLVQNS